MARQITVDLVSDTKAFERSMGSAEKSVESLDKSLDAAGKETARFEKGLEHADGSLDKAAFSFRGLDALASGLGATLGIEGLDTVSGYAVGIADMADGMKDLLLPMVAKAQAAFAAMNATLLANPIFLVIAAIAALGVAFVIAYKKSDTFRKIVNAAFDGVKDAVVGAWHAIKPIFDLWLSYYQLLWKGITSVVNGIKSAWNSVLGGRTIGIPSVSIPFAPDFPGFSFTIPMLAKGGPLGAGQMAIVGEKGPELFVPNMGGTVVPNHAIGGGGVTVIIQTGASDLDELIRKRVRVLGNGNVQTAFGRN
jgi:hypothetical protein